MIRKYNYFIEQYVDALRSREHFEKACELYNDTCYIIERLYEKDQGKWSHEYIKALTKLVSLYFEANQIKKYLETWKKLIQAHEQSYNKNPILRKDLFIRYLNEFINVCNNHKKYKMATLYIEKSYELKKLLSSQKPDLWEEKYIDSLVQLIENYGHIGQVQKAIDLNEKACGIVEELYIQNKEKWHSRYIKILGMLEIFYRTIPSTKKSIKQKIIKVKLLTNLDQFLSFIKGKTNK